MGRCCLASAAAHWRCALARGKRSAAVPAAPAACWPSSVDRHARRISGEGSACRCPAHLHGVVIRSADKHGRPSAQRAAAVHKAGVLVDPLDLQCTQKVVVGGRRTVERCCLAARCCLLACARLRPQHAAAHGAGAALPTCTPTTASQQRILLSAEHDSKWSPPGNQCTSSTAFLWPLRAAWAAGRVGVGGQ
jgi:hypothetical protein